MKPRCYLRDAVADTYVSKGYNCICNNALPYAKNLEDDTAIKNYRMMMCSACKFIEQIVVDNEVLHVKPDPPASLDKTPPKLYLL